VGSFRSRASVGSTEASGSEMQPDRAPPRPFLRDADGGSVRVLVKVLDLEPAPGGEAGSRVEVKSQDRAVAIVEDAVTRGQAHELARAGGGEGAGFLAGIGGFAAEELGMGRVGDGDRQSQFGGGLEVFEWIFSRCRYRTIPTRVGRTGSMAFPFLS
jgi:hypothetical protein